MGYRVKYIWPEMANHCQGLYAVYMAYIYAVSRWQRRRTRGLDVVGIETRMQRQALSRFPKDGKRGP